jgi:hypothetical protein
MLKEAVVAEFEVLSQHMPGCSLEIENTYQEIRSLDQHLNMEASHVIYEC